MTKTKLQDMRSTIQMLLIVAALVATCGALVGITAALGGLDRENIRALLNALMYVVYGSTAIGVVAAFFSRLDKVLKAATMVNMLATIFMLVMLLANVSASWTVKFFA